MPRQSDGTFIRNNSSFSGPTTWQQQANSQDDTISSTRHDSHDQDLADGLTDSLSRSGNGNMQSDLNLGGNGITNGNINEATVTVWSGEPRTAESIAKERVHVFDRIPPGQHSAILNGTSTYEANADIRNAAQDAITNGVPLVFPGPGAKIRYGDGSVTLMDAGQRGLEIYANGCRQEKTNTGATWITQDQVSGGTTTIALTQDATKGSINIVVPQSLADALNVGDILMLQSNAIAYFEGGDETRAREGRRVISKTGTTIELDSPLEFDFLVSDSAAGENFSQYMAKDLAIYDLYSVNSGGSTARMLDLRNVDGLRLYNFTGKAGGNILIVDTFDFYASDILCDRPVEGASAGNGYGLAVTGSSRYAQIRNLSGSNTRHLFTTNPRVIVSTNYGGPSRILINGGTSRQSNNTHIHDYDTHPEGNYITFTNVEAIRDGGSSGLKARCHNSTYLDCTTRGGNRGLETTSVDQNTRFINCIARDMSQVGLVGGGADGFPASFIRCSVFNAGDRGASSAVDGTYYEDIYIENPVSNAMRDQSTLGVVVKGATLVKGSDTTVTPLNGFTKSTGIYRGIDFVSYSKDDVTAASCDGGLFTECKWNGKDMANNIFNYTDPDYSVRAAFNNALHTNRGATTIQTATLPTGVAGMSIPFQRVASFALRVKPQPAETIDDQPAGNYLELATDDAFGVFECIRDGEWYSRQITGTFTPE